MLRIKRKKVNKFLPRVWSSSAFFSAAFACASAALALATCASKDPAFAAFEQYALSAASRSKHLGHQSVHVYGEKVSRRG